MQSSKKDELLVTPQDFAFGPGEENALLLECGRKLYDVNLRYETYGTLSESGDNAVLILHALTGDAHVCGKYSPDDRKAGWWDNMIGPANTLIPINTLLSAAMLSAAAPVPPGRAR